MVIRKTFTILMVCALSTLSFSPSLVKAQPIKDLTDSKQITCRRFVAGTYILSTFLNGEFVGRRVITLTLDGNFFSIDSNQGGSQGVPKAAQSFPNNRFTDGQGVWKCSQSGEFIATAFNFNFPAPQSTGPVTTGRADYRATFNPVSQTVEGTFEIRTFNLSANPLDNNVPVGEGEPFRFTFTGERVTVRN
ncbi:hypothetical protein [Nostoc flagelliforme]|uniref:hypothetical protein n=1 Tax=Nostoc flagelliforme TaxID=1306274 RepID=UPI000C2D22EB|nr:hypothetical protein [Nostoc flagelliforme]